MKPTLKRIKIAEIRRDCGTQIRAAMDKDTVVDYAEDMQRGDEFPAIVVFRVGEEYWLVDGFYRMAACERCGQTEINAEIHIGTRADALRFALSANSKHGSRRSRADMRHALQVAHREFPRLSARAIAKICAVGHTLAATVLQELSVTDSSSATPKRLGLDGKERSMPQFVSKSAKGARIKGTPKGAVSLGVESALLSPDQTVHEVKRDTGASDDITLEKRLLTLVEDQLNARLPGTTSSLAQLLMNLGTVCSMIGNRPAKPGELTALLQFLVKSPAAAARSTDNPAPRKPSA